MYKIIVIDIDGILLNDVYEIILVVCDFIKVVKVKGVKVVLCIGCLFVGIKKSLIELDFLDEGDYVIMFNGVVVLEIVLEKILVDIILNKIELEEIYVFCYVENVNVIYFDGKNMYVLSWKIIEIIC